MENVGRENEKNYNDLLYLKQLLHLTPERSFPFWYILKSTHLSVWSSRNYIGASLFDEFGACLDRPALKSATLKYGVCMHRECHFTRDESTPPGHQ